RGNGLRCPQPERKRAPPRPSQSRRRAGRRQGAPPLDNSGSLCSNCRIGRVKILVSNDDGYFAPGVTLLAEALGRLGEVTVFAPERDRSGSSNSLTLDRLLTVRRAPNGYFSVNGTPTDCVHIAVTGLLDFTPDLIVSGVNLGANMGDDTIYSGTVAAEGYQLGIPSVAVSLTSKTGQHFETAIGIAVEIVGRLKRAPFKEPVLLNVNVPDIEAGEVRGIEVTRLGKRHKAEPVVS